MMFASLPIVMESSNILFVTVRSNVPVKPLDSFMRYLILIYGGAALGVNVFHWWGAAVGGLLGGYIAYYTGKRNSSET
jgi:hypothetical protein